MDILIIGSGGREHALTWKVAQSPFADVIFVAPGNAATAKVATNVPIETNEVDKILAFAKENSIDLVIVGPEIPLSLGIVDKMTVAGIRCFGPTQAAARLETSKAFAKEVMIAAKVPTAMGMAYNDIGDALEFVLATGAPLVVKADGLAGGKGVVVGKTQDQIVNALELCFDGAYGEAGNSVVIEEFLEGEEVSLLCLCDGEIAIPFPSAQDHKQIGENDTGANTGGMGAYSPAPILPDHKLEELTDITVRPILKEMAKRGTPFKGILYAGLMMTDDGVKVIEYNVRFGDPECQVLLPRLENDLVELLLLAIQGRLVGAQLNITEEHALSVVVSAQGYPKEYPKGMEIKGIEAANHIDNIEVFHAGTEEKDGKILSTGGRILCVTGVGINLKEAQERAYKGISKIEIANSYYRKDIGAKGLKYS